MDKKRTAGAMAGAALAAAVVGEMLRRNGYSVNVRLQRPVRADARAIIDLVGRVEREVELIPAVREVTILAESPEAVRYRVQGTSPLGAWWAEYHKWWDYGAGSVGWASDKGSFGLRQRGQLNLEPIPGGTEMVLTTEYTSVWPVVGPAIAAAGKTLLVEPNFRAWLDNIALVLEAETDSPQARAAS
ncbi:MAG: hypothetical protein GX774_22045 [Armatimonadetes bacterium]|nr:hypothetical protein [Armatimonadota bacterium]